MMMTVWRFLAAKKVAVELVTPIAPDRPPVMLVRPRRIVSVDFDFPAL
jgi:hypothetical protein